MNDLERDLRRLVKKWETREELFDPEDDALAKRAVEMSRKELRYVLECNGVYNYDEHADGD